MSYSFVVLHDNEKKPAREINVGVTGQQFAWTFQYPPSVTGGEPVESDQLYLPENESVNFNLHSKDVIHAFWIPAFRLQEDVVPGITTHWRVTPDRLGSYPIVCNLLCGLGHSLMRSHGPRGAPGAVPAVAEGPRRSDRRRRRRSGGGEHDICGCGIMSARRVRSSDEPMTTARTGGRR